MEEEKGIDWSKDNIYDGIGRPDLKPKEEEIKDDGIRICTYSFGHKFVNGVVVDCGNPKCSFCKAQT